jgi:hypothetical protein
VIDHARREGPLAAFRVAVVVFADLALTLPVQLGDKIEPHVVGEHRADGLVRATAVACGWRDTLAGGCLRHNKRPPLGQCSRASLLISLPGDEIALLIEMIVDMSMN